MPSGLDITNYIANISTGNYLCQGETRNFFIICFHGVLYPKYGVIIAEHTSEIIQTVLPAASSRGVCRFKNKEDHTTTPAANRQGRRAFQPVNQTKKSNGDVAPQACPLARICSHLLHTVSTDTDWRCVPATHYRICPTQMVKRSFQSGADISISCLFRDALQCIFRMGAVGLHSAPGAGRTNCGTDVQSRFWYIKERS